MKEIEKMTSKEIENELRKEYKFDQNKPYVFISYSHRDKEKVYEVVLGWIRQGHNIFIDLDFENHPSDQNWIDQMKKALINLNCISSVCFVSINYSFSYPAVIELLTMKSKQTEKARGGESIDVYIIDMDGKWDNANIVENFNNNKSTYMESFNSMKNKMGDTFLEKMPKEEQLFKEGIKSWKGDEEEEWSALNDGYECAAINFYVCISTMMNNWIKEKNLNGNFHKLNKKPIPFPSSNKPENDGQDLTIVDEVIRTNVSDDDDGVSTTSGGEDNKPKKVVSVTGDITYTLYGKEYTHNQSDMMLTFFAQVLQRHPDKASELPEYAGMNCASRIDYTKPENRNEKMPSYFRVCVHFPVGDGDGICIGTAYSLQDKIKKMALLLDICNESEDVFTSEQVQLPKVKSVKKGSSERGKGNSDAVTYYIYEEKYMGNQSEMLETVCYEILRRHTDCLQKAAEELSCIALSDLSKVPKEEKPTYFRVMKCYDIDGVSVSVGASYSMGDKLKLIARLLILCNEPDDAFEIEEYDIPKTNGSKGKSHKDAASYMN